MRMTYKNSCTRPELLMTTKQIITNSQRFIIIQYLILEK